MAEDERHLYRNHNVLAENDSELQKLFDVFHWANLIHEIADFNL
jgi:hypothetical protein